MEQFSTLAVLVLLVVIAKEFRRSNAIVKENDDITLKKFHRFRTLRMQYLEPLVAIIIVGTLVATDIANSFLHIFAIAAGVILGIWFGAYRAKTTYIRAYPKYKAVVLHTNKEAALSLAALIVIKIFAEQDILPETGVFPIIVAFLLGLLLVESLARVYMVKRYYDRDSSKKE